MNSSNERRHGSHHQFITTGGSSNRPKFTTRHLAALGFLSNIPMAKESSIRETGLQNLSRVKALEEGNESDNEDESVDDEDGAEQNAEGGDQTDEFMKLQTDSVGIKLRGPAAAIVRYPAQFRYYFQHVSDQNAVVRQWEDQLLGKGISSPNPSNIPLLNTRVFCSRSRSYPSMVFSVIKYDAGEEKAKIQKLIADDHKGLEVFELPRRDWRGYSYKPLFKTIAEEKSGDHFFERGYLYDPNVLDDPSMLHGAHRYVLQRKDATGPIISSIIHFVNKQDLKESLNEQFRERHAALPPSLTLSKIRNLKKVALLTCVTIGIEISTVAIAMISFERLCVKSLVTKYNRRLSMAVSLLLAVKFNETATPNYHAMLSALLSFFDREWDLPRKQVFEAEFGAYVHLGFTLQLPFHHVYLMYTRMLKLLNESSKHYLGETMHEIYVQDVIAQERAREQNRNAQRERDRENREHTTRARAASVDSGNSGSGKRKIRKNNNNNSNTNNTNTSGNNSGTSGNNPSASSNGKASQGPSTITYAVSSLAEPDSTQTDGGIAGDRSTSGTSRGPPKSGQEGDEKSKIRNRKGGLMDKFPFLGSGNHH